MNGLPSTAFADVAGNRLEIGRAGDDGDRDRPLGELVEQHVAALVPDMHVEQHDVDAVASLTRASSIEPASRTS